ncbi:MAG: PBP1A family penicillin-binding protein [Caldilineaceae bacterium]
MDYFDLQEPRPAAPQTGRRFLAGLLSGMLGFLVLMLVGAGVAAVAYAVIAASLPSPAELASRASTFQTTRILDREGNLLNETLDPNAGRRTAVSLQDISPYLRQATIATEDANFYEHGGVDPFAIIRSLYYALTEGDVVSGASTIPQQLVKRVYLTPEATVQRKVKEAILSSEVSRRYDKDTILEMYLNEVYYGNLAYGAYAAAQTYFSKTPQELSLAEAALLAGLPQLPAYYDPYTHPDRAKERQAVVLGLMVENGYITPTEADAAWLEPLAYTPQHFDLEAPHFTLYVRQQLEQLYGPDALYKTGLNVTTTLDPEMQQAAESIVAKHVAALAGNNASNGALVAIRPDTGELLALVGSADFNNVEIDGQVNMAMAPRQPGSSIKPLVYLAAFEQPDKAPSERWTPGTLIADIEERFPDGANPPYVPTNYDGREHGMVTVRTALANSYNIPAVRATQQIGISALLSLAQRLGITTLNRSDYGLSLGLGAGEIPLIELTAAYATLANQGRRTMPASILKITDSQDDVLCEFGTDRPCEPIVTPGQQVVNPVDAFLITDILSDNEARTAAFGPNSVLQLDRPAAVKTGTTNDIRDNLTVGFTPQLVTGVWVGNADNSQMYDVSGVSGAGPIWHDFMSQALADEPALQFPVPDGVTRFEICADTGALFGEACPESRYYYFANDRPPVSSEHDLYQIIRLDKETGRLATEFTPEGAVEEKIFKVYPEAYREWAEQHGIPQPPIDESDTFTFGPELSIRQPAEGEIVSGVVQVYGTANAPAFANYELQYGVSHDPGAFSAAISGPYGAPVLDGLLGEWDTRTLQAGPHTLRLVVRDTYGSEYEKRVRVFVEEPTPTPLPTATWTMMPPTATWTEVPPPTPIPSSTPVPTSEPTATVTQEPSPTVTTPPVEATETPIPTDTPLPSPSATPTATIAPTEEPALTSTPSETATPVSPPPATDTPAPETGTTEPAGETPPEPVEPPTGPPAQPPGAEGSPTPSENNPPGG